MIHGFSSEIYFQIKVWGGLYMKQSSIFIYKSWLVNTDGLHMRVDYPMIFFLNSSNISLIGDLRYKNVSRLIKTQCSSGGFGE